MNKEDLISNTKHPKDCSEKDCCCGGHNHKNVKSNLNHHSTMKRLLIRQSRLIKVICLETK